MTGNQDSDLHEQRRGPTREQRNEEDEAEREKVHVSVEREDREQDGKEEEEEEEEKEELPYPTLAPVVLLALTQTSPPRSWCLRAVCHPYPPPPPSAPEARQTCARVCVRVRFSIEEANECERDFVCLCFSSVLSQSRCTYKARSAEMFTLVLNTRATGRRSVSCMSMHVCVCACACVLVYKVFPWTH